MRGEGRRGLKAPFVAATLFFYLAPLASLLTNPPEAPALVLLLGGWAVFGVVLGFLLRISPFERHDPGPWLAVAVVVLAAVAVAVQLAYRIDAGAALYFYAGATASRLPRERAALAGIALAGLAATLGMSVATGDVTAGISTGVTVATISLTLFAMTALGRSNRELQAARTQLAELAVSEERARFARDLHDTLGHTLSVIALKSELARRVVQIDPQRAATEIGGVELAARESLATLRETVSGYRQPSLAMELAGAREALRAAGIEGDVEPAPAGLPPEIDAVLGWAVREGVTNVLRHSEAAHATIRVRAVTNARSVEVVDDGRAAASPVTGLARPGPAGMGLTGLRERAERLGGGVEAGPLPDHGFRLHVTIPMPEASA